ncbi:MULTISPECIES: universal stress protein [Cohnella]|uniref:universal stress protein n=1 Tax=Cohnella TaxID=329857 RepID=UPI0009BB384A|nr:MULTISPECIES: universal stress protein [Cohnella]MBN2983862.1 universal stress protein [Cohnella algarum]
MGYTHILAAFDGSNLSRKALEHAIELAKAASSKLSVVHVYRLPIMNSGDMLITAPPTWAEQYEEESYRRLEAAKEIAGDAVSAEYHLLQGDPSRTLLDFAEQNGVDLIVTGSRGLGAIREFVLGSVSHNVVQHAKIPVLVVK